MKFKALAAAAALVASASSFAVPLTFIPTAGGAFAIATGFAPVSTFEFSVSTPSLFNGSLTAIDLGPLNYDFASVTLSGYGAYGGVSADLAVLGTKTLAAGNYTLTVTGVGNSGFSGVVNLVPSPIPEPETYALLLAGLGAVGFVARRRKAD